MNAQEFRKLALSLPEAHEAPHFERASFRVGKKIFATMSADEREVMVRVSSRDRVASLLEDRSGAFFSHGGWTDKMGALGVHLSKADAPLLQELLVDSWRSIAPKRALTQLK